MLGLSYEIHYKRGSENRAADALSRMHEEGNDELMTLTVVKPAWMEEVAESYEGDVEITDIIKKLKEDAQQRTSHTFSDGILRFKGRVCVGNRGDIK